MYVNIRKLYKYVDKCDDQQQYTDIIESAMVSTIEGLTNNSPLTLGPYVTVKILVQGNKSINFLKYWT